MMYLQRFIWYQAAFKMHLNQDLRKRDLLQRKSLFVFFRVVTPEDRSNYCFIIFCVEITLPFSSVICSL